MIGLLSKECIRDCDDGSVDEFVDCTAWIFASSAPFPPWERELQWHASVTWVQGEEGQRWAGSWSSLVSQATWACELNERLYLQKWDEDLVRKTLSHTCACQSAQPHICIYIPHECTHAYTTHAHYTHSYWINLQYIIHTTPVLPLKPSMRITRKC